MLDVAHEHALKVFETIEKFSVVKTMQAISDANIVVLVLDAGEFSVPLVTTLAGCPYIAS